MPVPKRTTPPSSYDSLNFVGVDPGKQGGVVVIHCFGGVQWYLMPETPTDLLNLFLDLPKPIRGCLEQVRSMPNDGHSGAFTFGEGYGRLQMAFTAAAIPFNFVIPRTWQKHFGVQPRQGKKGESQNQFKDRLRGTAQRLFPEVELWSQPRTLGKQRAMCDALLIAQYAKDTYLAK